MVPFIFDLKLTTHRSSLAASQLGIWQGSPVQKP